MADMISLRVAPTNQQEDVGAGRARMDTASRLALGISPGDIVEIRGRKTTCAVVWRMVQSQDENKGTLRIDGLTRKNAGLSIGDKVIVARAEPKPAKKVILAPVIEGNNKIKFGQGFDGVVKRGLVNRPMMKDDIVFIPGMALMGGTIPFLVVSTYPSGIVQMNEDTELGIREEAQKESAQMIAAVSYEDVGGLKEELRRVREMIELPLKHPELFERLGIDPPKGILLHGPPGTGKTMIARAVASESGASFFSIQGPEIMDKYYGASEEHLRKRFEEAQKASPSILFIDELDSIAPKRGDVHGEVERRVVAQMLTLMDGLSGRGKLIVIAATNRVDAIDPALRRPGRFDREIEIGVPDREGRLEILQVHTRGMPLDNVDLGKLADITHGFVGADLAALCKEAAMRSLRRLLPDFYLDRTLPPEDLEKILVTADDFNGALKEIEPSALRDLLTEIPAVHWEEVGGLEEVKDRLKEMVEWPLKRPEAFKRLGIHAHRGILMYGPPGTGKTMLAKAVATESAANFISIKGPEVFSKWVGESEKAIREIFKKARQSSPSIVFLDELDALAPRRSAAGDSGAAERVVNQLLTSLDGLERLEQVVVLAATNRPDMIDPALLRPGRFDRMLMVPPPDRVARLAILKVHTKNVPLEGVDLEALAVKLEGYVGADIEAVVREAALAAMREDAGAKSVLFCHFETAMAAIRASADDQTMKYYNEVGKELSGLRRIKDEPAGYR